MSSITVEGLGYYSRRVTRPVYVHRRVDEKSLVVVSNGTTKLEEVQPIVGIVSLK